MATVDPADDTLYRVVVFHYRFDPPRRQRRHVCLGAYDNWAEAEAVLRQLDQTLFQAKSAGRAEAVERLSAVVKEPGYTAEHRRRREEWRQFKLKKVRIRRRHRLGEARAA